MSRIGKIPIPVPGNVTVVQDKNEIRVKGPKGELSLTIPQRVSVKHVDGELRAERHGDDKQAKAFHGLVQRMLTNMVTGVTDGFRKELEIQGVGYRANMEGSKLNLLVGKSHPVAFEAPSGITFEVPKPTSVIISGYDKQQVGQVAAQIRRVRPPEPYKGKGIRYVGEVVRRKVGKSAGK
jgi:large subunit ribosomal protein L6